MIEVVDPGLLTTVQDGGRTGYQAWGVTVGGAVDRFSLNTGNLLVGNHPDAPGIEMNLIGAVFRAHETLAATLTGADFSAKLDGKDMPLGTVFLWPEGSLLSLKGKPDGARCYLTVSGGIDVPEVLKSASTDLIAGIGGTGGRALKKGDKLKVGEKRMDPSVLKGRRLSPVWFRKKKKKEPEKVRVVFGPHDDAFTQKGKERFTSATFQCSHRMNRMGLQCLGEPVEHKNGADIISAGVTFGSIQVPADGQPFILLADRQTTGGYTQIATVIRADFTKIAQLMPGDRIRFCPVSLGEAREALGEQDRFLKQLSAHNQK